MVKQTKEGLFVGLVVEQPKAKPVKEEPKADEQLTKQPKKKKNEE